MFGPDVHGNLTQIKIGSDSGSCRNPGLFHYIGDHFCSKLSGCHLIHSKIMGDVHKHLIYRIDMHVLRCQITEVNVIDPGAVVHVQRHSRRCCHIGNGQFRMRFQFIRRPGFSGKTSSWCFCDTCLIDFFYTLDHFKKSRSSWYSIGLQRRGNCQADGFFGSFPVCHNKIGGKWI